VKKQSAYGTAGKAEAQAEGHGILKINLSLARQTVLPEALLTIKQKKCILFKILIP
jgi:hypothetical protein